MRHGGSYLPPPHLLAALLLSVAACQRSASPEARWDPSAAVAKIDGTTITGAELDALVKDELTRFDRQYQEEKFQLRRFGLERALLDRALASKARALGIPKGEVVDHEVAAKLQEPTEEEIREVHERARASDPGLPALAAMKERVVEYVKEQRRQAALHAFHEQLQKDLGIEILLSPPRVKVEANGPSKGPEDAPVTIVQFGDYECPYCVRTHRTLQELLPAYAGKVRLVFRDFPASKHPLAQKAAEATHCAEDQGKFWEMHDLLLTAGSLLDVAPLKQHARTIGLDGESFDRCLDSGAKADVVRANRKAGDEARVHGTPAFFINGRFLAGTPPAEAFQIIIDQELASAPQAPAAG